MRDLADSQQQKEEEKLRKDIDYVHMAPPCGTASEARNIKLSLEDKARGAPEPQPLRSKAEPWGFKNMSKYNRMKVDKANMIYLFCISTIIWCCTQTPPVPFTLENPSRSLLWELPPMKEVIARFGLIILHTHTCACTGARGENSRES